MDPALSQLLRDSEATPRREVEAILRLRRVGDQIPGAQIVARFGHVATCRVHAADVRAVRAHPRVASMKAARPVGPELTDVRPTRPGPRPAGVRHPVRGAPTGAGVVVGVVDWGVDVLHPGVRRGDGTTRLLAVWDQRDGPGPTPQPYGYGRVHHRADIDAALRTPDAYRTLGLHPGTADRGHGSHGCHVTDIAAGNGRGGGPSGVAPEASLVFVHLADRGTGGLATLGDSVRLLEAVDFVRRAAGRRPWVVNVSVGRHGGPHDGRTLIELAFDELLATAPGRFLVQSAGNYFQRRTHATGVLSQGQTRTLTFHTRPRDVSVNELEVWYDEEDALTVRLTPPGAVPGGWVPLGAQTELVAHGVPAGRLYHRASDPNNGDHHVDAFLLPSAPAGAWRLDLRGTRVVNGRYHAWLERDDACSGCQAVFTPGTADASCTLGTLATGHLPLVVGAYDGEDPARPVARFSSSGPTRDGRSKPDVLAPGVDVLAARSTPLGQAGGPSRSTRKSGTSMAAPYVTGAVALCLQATGGQIDARAIRALVMSTARPARALDTARAGAGYVDLPALLDAVRQWNPAPRPSPHEEHDMSADPTSRLRTAPARMYRELLYRPDGELARWIDRRFEVLARPGQAPVRDAQPGDLFLQVPLGRPGPGTCTVLDGQPSPRRMAHGQLLLHPRERAGAPASTLGGREEPRARGGGGPGEDLAEELLAAGYGADPGTALPGGAEEADEGDDRGLGEFSGPEHRDIGDRALPATLTAIRYGTSARFTFGEVVALAGDYFETYDQMVGLSRTRAGQEELAYARWKGLDLPSPAPQVPGATAKTVADRYLRLASDNISHFSAGGTAWQSYTAWHSRAVVGAFEAGQTSDAAAWRRALGVEAFGLHFLTDSFAAGHVRTPRREMRDWYRQHYAGDALIDYLAGFMYDRLRAGRQLPALLTLELLRSWVRDYIADRIRTVGGEAANSLSIGDVVGLALHDYDNNGLWVLSDVDVRGRKVPGGFSWRAVGDGHLGSHPLGPATRDMAVAAVSTSLEDLGRVREAGRRAGRAGATQSQRLTLIRQALGGPVFAARSFVPRENVGDRRNAALVSPHGTRAALEWRWGRLGPVAHREVDSLVRNRLARELRAFANAVPDPVPVPVLRDIRGTRAAFLDFTKHLRDDGIAVLERAVGRPAR